MIIALTGAGISAASGIPTFENSPGLRDKLTRTYANENPKGFQETIESLRLAACRAMPNDAHYALGEYNIPVITMNIDGLHELAGAETILPIHGELETNNVVLYGDSAPLYSTAMNWVTGLDQGDILLIVGTSFYTGISQTLYNIARLNLVDVKVINKNAETEVRKFLENHKQQIESLDLFMARFDEDYIPPIKPPYIFF